MASLAINIAQSILFWNVKPAPKEGVLRRIDYDLQGRRRTTFFELEEFEEVVWGELKAHLERIHTEHQVKWDEAFNGLKPENRDG